MILYDMILYYILLYYTILYDYIIWLNIEFQENKIKPELYTYVFWIQFFKQYFNMILIISR